MAHKKGYTSSDVISGDFSGSSRLAILSLIFGSQGRWGWWFAIFAREVRGLCHGGIPADAKVNG
jgi:hypothetical protein